MGGRIHVSIAAIAVSAVLLAACGDDEEAPITPADGATGATGAGGALSAEAFISEADDICLEANTALANLTVGEAGSEAIASQELAITEGLYDSLRSLGDPPADGSEDYDAFLSALRDAIDALEKRDLAARRGDAAAAEAASADADAALADAREAAADYGFEECGEEGEELDGATDGGGAGDTGGVPGEAPVAPAAPAPPPATPAPSEPAPEPAPEAPPSGGAPSGGTGSDGGGGSGGVSP